MDQQQNTVLKLSNNILEALKWIDSQQNFLVKHLITWSEINSGSTNYTGLNKQANAIFNLFKDKLASNLTNDYKYTSQIIPLKNITPKQTYNIQDNTPTGPIIIFEKKLIKKTDKKTPQIILTGHYDTVFSEKHKFQKTSKKHADILQGPGVADMKGGILVMLTAVMAFEKFNNNNNNNNNNINWKIILNPDEEIGSPASRKYLENAAKDANKNNGVGLVYEPSATPDGCLAGARPGSGAYKVTAHGKSAHAGRDLFNGKNAIIALSEVAMKIHKLSKPNQSLLINIARFNADSPLNQVPDLAYFTLNIRAKNKELQDYFEQKLDLITKEVAHKTGCKINYTGSFSRPPKPLDKNQLKLFNLAKQCGQALNLQIKWKSVGGVCDGNNLAASGIPVLDTLGVRGGLIHTDQEYMHLNSLTERAKLSTLLLFKLAENKIKNS